MEFYKEIIFTKTPLKGIYRYQDLFQIYPAELDKMPESKFQKHYPVIIEYAISPEDEVIPEYLIEGLEEFSKETATRSVKVEELLRLLTVFSNHLFFRYKAGDGFWGVPITEDEPGEKANSWRSYWDFKMFFWPEGPQQKIDSFTEQSFDKVSFRAHHPYFMVRPNLDIHTDKNICFPTSINEFITAYYKSPDSVKSVVLRAMNHLYSSVELLNSKNTLSLISAFTSIENMIELEYQGQTIYNCDSCSQPKFQVTKKFREYLTNYVGQNDTLKRKFNLYYKKRSKIIHIGEVLATEVLYSGLPKHERDEDSITHLEVIQVSRLAISHWLHKKYSKN